MANTAGLTYSFKSELLTGTHNLNSASIKAALYLASASLAPSTTTAYTVTGELAATGNYAAGGIAVTNGTVASTAGTAYWTPAANLQYGSSGSPFTSSGAFDSVLFYNTSATNKSIGIFSFGSQSINAGIFTLTMPTNDSSTGLIRLA